MLLFFNSLSHLLVDALCAAVVLGQLAGSAELAVFVMLYNTLAFSIQCLIGLLTDKLGRHDKSAALAALLVVLAYLLPAPPIGKVILAGAGNSLFHVAGGTMTLLESRGKAGRLGVFVAPGCIGLTWGTLYPQFGGLFAGLLAICAVFIVVFWSRTPIDAPRGSGRGHGAGMTVPVLLTCAVAVRAIGGCAVSFPWKTGTACAMLMTLSVFSGKIAGGFLCDQLGSKKTACISILPAAVLIAFFSDSMVPSLIGQLALNLTMPVTLWLLYRAMPDSPGFAFGLAASALWPGTIAGELMTLTGPLLWLCVILSFCFGLFAIWYSASKILDSKTGGL